MGDLGPEFAFSATLQFEQPIAPSAVVWQCYGSKTLCFPLKSGGFTTQEMRVSPCVTIKHG